MSEPLLFQADQVAFAYESHEVIAGMSLAIPPGRFYGIVGPNGSGKTTLLDILMGIKKPLAGKVRFRGREVSSYSRKDMARRAALVPQEFAIDFPFTVREVVMMGRHPYIHRFGQPSDTDREMVDRALRDIGLESLAEQYVTDLSGGEKQRVVLARALAQDTDVLVLDEPTSNLDINFSLHILGVIKSRVRSGERSALAVMHDLNLAASFCDELVFLKRGRVHAVGPRDEVLTPDNIHQVFDVRADVFFNEFSGRQMVAFRKEDRDA